MADAFKPGTSDFQARVRKTFARQPAMATIGAEIVEVAPGRAVLAMPIAEAVRQQHGFAHAGMLTTLADTACGLAALTLFPAGAGVLTIEFKVNLLAPAAGIRLIATGQVKRSGRQITVCQGEVEAEAESGARKVVALITATMMTVEGKAGIAD
jgi:uncharacterized protein (TIGR00369 family)